MKHLGCRLGTVSLALALLAISASLPADSITFHPAESSVASKHFSTECELALDDMRLSMNGEDADPSMLGIPSDLTVSFGYLVECSDEYVAVANGRTTELLRSFESLSSWFVDPDGSRNESEGDLEGHMVRFRWNEDDGDYDREAVGDDDVEEEQLAVLGEDLDLRSLLPEGEVDEGHEWEVAGPALMAVLLPGLDLQAALKTEHEGITPEIVEAISGFIERARATCSYAGTTEEDGRRFAVIDLACKLSDDVQLDTSMTSEDVELGGDVTMDIGLDLDIEGRCLWDPGAGHFHSLSLEGDGTVEVEFTLAFDELGMNMEGTAEFSLDFKREAGAE